MPKHTQTDTARAEKKVQIAIDKIVDLQDLGFGCDLTARILEQLNQLESRIRNGD